jgi:hypothetical protein
MKLTLLPLVIASAASQDIETSALLQTTKQQKLEERANSFSSSGLNGLEGSVAGKKDKGKHNVCDEEEAKKLIECFKFGPLSLSSVLAGGDAAEKQVAEVAVLFSTATDVEEEKSCETLHDDMTCMQSNACWKENLVDVPHEAIKAACAEGNADADVYPGVKFSALCAFTPLKICESITTEEHIANYLEGCNEEHLKHKVATFQVISDVLLGCD